MPQHRSISRYYNDVQMKEVAAMTERQVLRKLVEARWGDAESIRCPTCQSQLPVKRQRQGARSHFRCRNKLCLKHFNVTTGTAFDRTKLSICSLYHALAAFVIKADETIRNLMVDTGTSYKTAFFVAARIRVALQWHHDQQPLLHGDLEADGAVFCHRVRPTNNGIHRKANTAVKKAAGMSAWVVVLLQTELSGDESEPTGRRAAKIKVFIVDSERTINLKKLLSPHIQPGSTLRTDGLERYTVLGRQNGYRFPLVNHQSVDHDVQFQTPDGVNENTAESFHGLLREMVGARHGISPTYLAEYAKEAAWRRVMNDKRASERLHLLAQACLTAPFDDQLRGYTRRSRRTRYELFKMDGPKQNGIDGARLSPRTRPLEQLPLLSPGDRQHRIYGGGARRSRRRRQQHNGGFRPSAEPL